MRNGFLVAALVVAGCDNGGGPITQLAGDLYSTPSFILDFGPGAIGGCRTASLKLDAERAPVKVIGVNVTNTTREGVFFPTPDCSGEPWGSGSASLDTGGVGGSSDEGTIDANGDLNLVLGFLPPVAGYFQGQVEIVHTGRSFGRGAVGGDVGASINVDLRGRGVEPCYQVSPAIIDFGQVDPGEEVCRDVRVTTCSDLPLVLTSLQIAQQDFRPSQDVSSDAPLTVAGNANEDVELCFEAVDRKPKQGRLNLFSGSEALTQSVTLIANDCVNGLPSAYDQDGDGFTASVSETQVCGGDCDDNDPNVNPGEVEGSVPDGKDNNCDGLFDNKTKGFDDDGDGYCDDPSACIDGSLPGDCNDGDPDVNPGETEDFGNGIDDDCDGTTDNGTIDLDGDGYTVDGGDCDDNPATGATRYPGAPEIPDGKDNDCDLFIDEGTTAYDDDGDGYCEGPTCADGSTPGDCDDRYDEDNPSNPNHPGAISHPGATELADGRDNNCDDRVDDGTDRFDDDGDGYTEIGGDCNDTTDAIAPNVLEIPGNSIDDDCNPNTPVGEAQ